MAILLASGPGLGSRSMSNFIESMRVAIPLDILLFLAEGVEGLFAFSRSVAVAVAVAAAVVDAGGFNGISVAIGCGGDGGGGASDGLLLLRVSSTLSLDRSFAARPPLPFRLFAADRPSPPPRRCGGSGFENEEPPSFDRADLFAAAGSVAETVAAEWSSAGSFAPFCFGMSSAETSMFAETDSIIAFVSWVTLRTVISLSFPKMGTGRGLFGLFNGFSAETLVFAADATFDGGARDGSGGSAGCADCSGCSGCGGGDGSAMTSDGGCGGGGGSGTGPLSSSHCSPLVVA